MKESHIMLKMSASITSFCLALSIQLAAGETLIEVDAAQVKCQTRQILFGQNIESGDSRGLFSLPVNAPEPRSFEVKYGQGYWDPAGKRPATGVLEIMKGFPFGALRYPGGCLAHNFRWKETVGPIEERGSKNWDFGLDEYLQLCKALNCAPQLIVTDYGLSSDKIPQDTADLVEYLNMPATPEHPWAMKRAKNGHEQPYGVKYFEIGNESYHGNHNGIPRRQFSPDQYSDYFNSTVEAMKKVDPSIMAGYVMEDHSSPWSMAVAKGCARNADFAVVHTYYPRLDGIAPEQAFKGSMAANEQFDWLIEEFRKTIRLGGRELPIGLTEFNVHSVAMTSNAARFSYTAGMQCAELWCKLLQPESKILMANYWCLLNAMYGVVVTTNGNDVPENYSGKLISFKAPARFFQALRSFTGAETVECKTVNAPRFDAIAVPGAFAARGEDSSLLAGAFAELPLESFNLESIRKLPGASVTASSKERTLSVKLDKLAKDAYPVFATTNKPSTIPEGATWNAKLSFEARFVPAAGSGTGVVGAGLMDSRGWEATHCAQAIYVNDAKDWKPFSATLNMLDSSEQVSLLLRFQQLQGEMSGTLEFRKIKVEGQRAIQFPAYSGVTGFASKSEDGKKLYLIVFNRSYSQSIPSKIELKGFEGSKANVESLYREKVESVEYFEPVRKELKLDGSSLRYELPPHSMTCFEFVK